MAMSRREHMGNFKQRIYKLFQKHLVLDMLTLQHHLDNRSKRSIHRDIAGIDYYSSYTHSGKYYTLKQTPSFNSNGIWFYKMIGFSQHGTLKQTLVAHIETSEAGKLHIELKKDLLISVHNSLLELVNEGQIKRAQINNFYVYLSIDEKKYSKQLKKRHQLIATIKPTVKLPPPLLRIEIFSEIIKVGKIKFDEKEILSRLKNRDIQIRMDDLERVIIYYDIKKNTI